ncbi:MAG: hypothetical protein ABIR08_10445 [Sphingomonas sp.]
MIGEILLEAIGALVTDGWEEITRATHDRFGWVAATIVALSPIAMIVLLIWLIVVWVS